MRWPLSTAIGKVVDGEGAIAIHGEALVPQLGRRPLLPRVSTSDVLIPDEGAFPALGYSARDSEVLTRFARQV
jgi:hypothetical protein